MAKIYREAVVNTEIEKCFDFIADPAKAAIFVGSLHSVTPVSVEPKGVGNTWNWEYDMFGIPITGNAECIEYTRPNKYVWKSTEGVKSTWVYTFAKANGGTKISLSLEYAVPDTALVGQVADKLVLEKLNENEAENAFKNLKTILES